MDSSSSSSSTSSLHLAMAALVGASLMAISAFYIHKRSVDQVLQRLIGIRRKPTRSARNRFVIEDDEADDLLDDDGGWDCDGEMAVDPRMLSRSLSKSPLDENMTHSYIISSSMPNVALRNDWLEEEVPKFDQPLLGSRARGFGYSLDKLNLIPLGLRPLRMDQRNGEDQFVKHSGMDSRLASVGRLVTPRSSGGNTYDNAEDSDEEGTELAYGEEVLFNYGYIDIGNELTNAQITYKLFGLADVNTNNPNITVLLMDDYKNGTQDNMCRATGSEVKAGVDLCGNGKADTSSVHILGDDSKFFNTSLPLRKTPHESRSVEEEDVLRMICECLDLGETYVYWEMVELWMREVVVESNTSEMSSDPFLFERAEATAHHYKMEDGIVHVYASKHDTADLFPVASSTQFFTDMHHLLKVTSIGNVRSMCHHRLRFLEEKFHLHLLVNADGEFLAQKSAPHRDFYNIRKVGTHVHHSACMNQKHLLRFIKSKLKKEPDEVVIFRDGKYMTLKEVFESLDLTGHDLNVDLLDVHADKSTFHRFEKFNLKYNPCGQSTLREIFLKQDNLIQGRFLAEVTKEVLSDLEASRYQMAEYRISIYGRKQSEWDQLASWFVNNEIYSNNAVWLIQEVISLAGLYLGNSVLTSLQASSGGSQFMQPPQHLHLAVVCCPFQYLKIPRLYNVYKKMGIVTFFQNLLDNVFIPLFEVTIDPSSHPQLHLFLIQVVGFDLVDDESKPERRPTKHMPTPAEWTNEFNPAYSYYAYYCYANLYTLNKLRESKGMPTIKLRPHCGKAGDIDHLAAAFLLCHNISHGINLRKSPVLQYLYYLAQIGLAMSPLSNNSLFLDYHCNPLPLFFQRGLNVSLSTDDPLQIHLTKDPLVEEYSVAAKVWKLSACDLCEIARNSVYQSGFSHVTKLHWLGDKYLVRGPEGNDIQKTNVPNLRILFRHKTWKEEMQYVYSGKPRFPEEIES